MRLVRNRGILSLVLLAFLFGCQSLDKSSDKPAKVSDLNLQSTSNQYQHVNRAISLLEKGKRADAKKLISEVLIANPKQKTALSLKQQLSLSAADFFKTKRFTTYQVKVGDSLGGIAHKWLGNSLYFVSLAKLNNINKPALLQPGSKIRIPLTEKSHILINEKKRSSANLQLLDNYYAEKHFILGLKKSNSLFFIKQHYAQLLSKQMFLLEGLSRSVVSISGKEEMLIKVNELKLSARNPQQKIQFQDFINTQKRNLFLQESILLFDDKSFLDSAKKLVQVKRLDESVTKQTKVFRMEKIIINKLHEQAIVYYRKHSLSNALEHWQLIKQLQPKNMLADKYINRTKILLDKLNQY